MNWYEKEEDNLVKLVNNGEITDAEFNREMRLLRDELKGQAEEAADQAYNDAMEGW